MCSWQKHKCVIAYSRTTCSKMMFTCSETGFVPVYSLVMFSVPAFSAASSFILYFADRHEKEKMLCIHSINPTVKQEGLKKRRSTCLICATGLYWFLLLHWPSFQSFLFSYYLLGMKIFQHNVAVFTFHPWCRPNDRTTNICDKYWNVAQLDNLITQVYPTSI